MVKVGDLREHFISAYWKKCTNFETSQRPDMTNIFQRLHQSLDPRLSTYRILKQKLFRVVSGGLHVHLRTLRN